MYIYIYICVWDASCWRCIEHVKPRVSRSIAEVRQGAGEFAPTRLFRCRSLVLHGIGICWWDVFPHQVLLEIVRRLTLTPRYCHGNAGHVLL